MGDSILFQPDMVCGILDGIKTQTRRLVDIQAGYDLVDIKTSLGYPASDGFTWAGFTLGGHLSPLYVKCPYGSVGGDLWLREACAIGRLDNGELVCDYKADGQRRRFDITPEREKYLQKHVTQKSARRPSIFMPRWASRLTLRVAQIRVERLQAISEEDARAEGVAAWSLADGSTTYRLEYSLLWDKINGVKGRGWQIDPWVWVIVFEPFLNWGGGKIDQTLSG